mmetsp:Transcript_9639/g.27002  ORF Transcript_9639/g.27002 Transcript_9639/m.27002 type:complete len:229 (-) Transcript_9639:714-1400(-)
MYQRQAGRTLITRTDANQSFVKCSGTTVTFSAMLSTATSKHFSQEKPMSTPRVVMILRTAASESLLLDSSLSAIQSKTLVARKDNHVRMIAWKTSPEASLFRNWLTSNQTLNAYMTHQAKTRLSMLRMVWANLPVPKHLFKNTRRGALPTKHTTMLTASRREICVLVYSPSAGRSPSVFGSTPWTKKRIHCTERNDNVSDLTSSSVSSTKWSHMCSFSSLIPSSAYAT